METISYTQPDNPYVNNIIISFFVNSLQGSLGTVFVSFSNWELNQINEIRQYDPN